MPCLNLWKYLLCEIRSALVKQCPMKSLSSVTKFSQWTGFHTTRTSVMKELMLCYLHVFIEIYSLIMTKIIATMHPNIKGGCF